LFCIFEKFAKENWISPHPETRQLGGRKQFRVQAALQLGEIIPATAILNRADLKLIFEASSSALIAALRLKQIKPIRTQP